MLKVLGSEPRVWFHYGHEFWESRGSQEGAREAVKAYRTATALKRDYPEAWNRLWQCLRGLMEVGEARKAAEAFLEYGRDHPDAPAALDFLDKTKDVPAGGRPH